MSAVPPGWPVRSGDEEARRERARQPGRYVLLPVLAALLLAAWDLHWRAFGLAEPLERS
jgi:hypothetical protein